LCGAGADATLGAVPKFEIVQSHSVTVQEARRRLERFSALVADRYGLTPTWISPVKATIERTGAHGTLEIEGDQIRVNIDLPFALALFREKIESRIRRELGYLFADESKYDEAAYEKVYGAKDPAS
jgi:putative polyhydroxyalkanoate system protein